MHTNDIQQKISLLPEGIEKENLRTWQEAEQYYQRRVSHSTLGSRFKHLLNLIHDISKSEQENLFRVYCSIMMLIISTSDSERVGEGQGIPFIVVDSKSNESDALYIVGYYEATTSWEITECMSDELAPTLQPL